MVLSRFERENKLTDSQFYLLDLLSYRSLSDQISSDLESKHESPQLLIIGMKNAYVPHIVLSIKSILTIIIMPEHSIQKKPKWLRVKLPTGKITNM